MSILKTQAIGYIGKDAVVRQVENGDNVINFNVAVSLGTKDNPKTQWVTCSYWRRAGESTELAKYLKTGTQVYVEGTPSARAWQAQDGTLNANLELTAYTIKLLSSGKQDDQQQGQAQAQVRAQTQVAQPQQAYAPPKQNNFAQDYQQMQQRAQNQVWGGNQSKQYGAAHNPDDDLPF